MIIYNNYHYMFKIIYNNPDIDTHMDLLTGLCSDHPLGRAMQWSPYGNEKNLNLCKFVSKTHPIKYWNLTRNIIEKYYYWIRQVSIIWSDGSYRQTYTKFISRASMTKWLVKNYIYKLMLTGLWFTANNIFKTNKLW